MGPAGIPWLERPERQSEEDIAGLINALGLTSGMVVTNLGAGSGVMSMLMAKKVGPKGKVIALEIQDKMLAAIAKNAKQQNIKNVYPRKSTITSLGVKEGV